MVIIIIIIIIINNNNNNNNKQRRQRRRRRGSFDSKPLNGGDCVQRNGALCGIEQSCRLVSRVHGVVWPQPMSPVSAVFHI
jgi:hypothetical protein